MSAIEILSAPLAQAVGWALLHLLWQATIVAGILAAALSLLSRHTANTRYAVSCAALILVFALFAGTAWRAYEPAPAAAPATTSTTEEQLVPVTRVPMLLAAAAADSWRDRALAFVARAQQSLPVVVAIWLAGVIVLSSRLLVSWVHARRLVRASTQPAAPHWRNVAARLSHALGLKRAVELVESAAVEVPSVIGSLRPVILFPASALTGMTPEQIEMVLAHELAHIRRHDFFVNLLQAMVETLMFYHPAVWWMSRRVRIERENCCDDMAVAVCGNPIQYARALARLEELRAHAPAIAVAANGGSLLDRVRRIVMSRARAESTGSSSRWAAAAAMLSIVVIALALPSLPALADRDEPVKKEQKQAAAKMDVVAPHENTEPAEDIDVEVPDEVDVDVDDPGDAVDVDMDVDVDAGDMAPMIAVEAAVAIEPGRAAMPMPVAVVAPALAPMPAEAPMLLALQSPAPPAPPAPAAPVIAPGRIRANSTRKFGTSGKLTVDELISLRSVGVTPDYVEKMRAIFPNLTLGDATSLRTMGVTSEYITNMRAAGMDVKTARDATSLAAMGVTSEYIRNMRAAGVKIESTKDATSLAAMGVTTDFVKKLAAAGYGNLSVRELTRLAAAGVDANFIEEMSKYRDKD